MPGTAAICVDILQPARRLDLGDEEDVVVRRRHLGDDVAAGIVVVGDAEGRAAAARAADTWPNRRSARACSAVSTIGTIRPIAPTSRARAIKWYSVAGHAHHRHQVGGARGGHQHADGFHAPAGVLHVVDDELGPGLSGDAADAGGGELEHHRAQRPLPALDSARLDPCSPSCLALAPGSAAAFACTAGVSIASRLTTLAGTRPAATSRIERSTLSPMTADTLVGPAEGVRGDDRRCPASGCGSSGSTGSCSKTSSPAPAMRRSRSASSSAA